MRSPMTVIVCLLMLLCMDACTAVQPQTEFRSPDNLMPGDRIVLLSSTEISQRFDDDDVDKCIGSSMRHANPDLLFVSATQFRENLYPYFMQSTTPTSLEDYKNLLDKSEVQQRIATLHVRFLVMLVTSGTITDWHGDFIGGVGPGGGGYIGLSWWDRKSALGVVIWDLQTKQQVGKVGAEAAGTGVMPTLGLPVPFYTPATEAAVCADIGRRLAELLSGRESH